MIFIKGNGQSAGKDLAYLYGVYLGDGSITKRSEKHYQFAFETIDYDFMEHVLEVIFNLTGKSPKVSKRNRGKKRSDTYYISVSNIFFKEMYEETAKKQIIPEWVKEGSLEIKRAFLQGCLDSDGYVSCHHNKKGLKAYSMGYCKGAGYVFDIITLMKDVGLQIPPPRATEQKSKKVCFYLVINMQSWLKSGMKFSIKRKNDRVEEYKLKQGNPQRLYA